MLLACLFRVGRSVLGFQFFDIHYPKAVLQIFGFCQFLVLSQGQTSYGLCYLKKMDSDKLIFVFH